MGWSGQAAQCGEFSRLLSSRQRNSGRPLDYPRIFTSTPARLVGELGFEPRLAESEPAVLPLDDSPKIAAFYRLIGNAGRSMPASATRGKMVMRTSPRTSKIPLSSHLVLRRILPTCWARSPHWLMMVCYCTPGLMK